MDPTIFRHSPSEQHPHSIHDQPSTPSSSDSGISQVKKATMHSTPSECSCWSTHPTATTVVAVGLFVSISITIGVLIVSLTISKAAIHNCRLNFQRTKNNPLDYSCNPRSVAIGDFNNDTWPDFVVTNAAVNNISVFLASTNGTFGQPATYPTGSDSTPSAVAVAHLNNDQQLDIIVAYSGTNSVGVFLGLDNGSFVNHKTFSTGSAWPVWIHIAHLDNDTFLDLVTADYGTDSITLFSGDGEGNFFYRMTYSTGYDSSPVCVVAGDFNDDNQTDLAVANSGTNNMGIFFGKGNGEFSEQKIFSTGVNSHPNSIAVGHLNNDMRLDIAIGNYGTNNTSVFLNTGNGTFGEQTTYLLDDASPYAIGIADINKDKHSDLVVVSRGTNSIGILLGHGNGNFSQAIMFVTGSLFSISVAIDDLNKDELLDIVVISNDTNTVCISFGKDGGFQSDATYSTDVESFDAWVDRSSNNSQLTIIDAGSNGKDVRIRRQYNPGTCSGHMLSTVGLYGSSSVVVGDLNNDGHLDMVVRTAPLHGFLVFLGYGNGSFARKTTYQTDAGPLQLKIADFNSDGLPDIVVAYNSPKYVYTGILLGYGNGSFANQATYSTSVVSGSIAVGDFNQDHLLDLIVVDYRGDASVLLGYGNGSFASPVTHSIDAYSTLEAVGHFNNDTILDLIVSNSYYDSIGVLLGYGNGSFANQITYAIDFSPQSVVVGDFNDDTILDAVVLHNFDDSLSVFIGYGNGSFTHPMTFSTDITPRYATVSDFNNDDRLDLVLVNSDDNNMSVFFGYGNGSFADYSTCSAGRRPSFAAVADFNEDGRSDIVVTHYGDSYVSVFLFSQIQFTRQKISSGSSHDSRLQCVAANDFNNDSFLDIVVANYGTKTIALFLGHGDGSFNEQTRFSLHSDSNPQSITVGDFNKDNLLDLAVANAATNSIDMLLGDGRRALTLQRGNGYSLEYPPSIVLADDFNHDGHSEVVVAYDSSDNIDILIFYNPTNFTDQTTYSTGSGVRSVTMGDFNNDGIIDLAVTNYDDNSVGILLGNGDGSFANPTISTTGVLPHSIVVGDLNNDTYLDIAVANVDNVGILLGYGNGSFANQTTYPIDAHPLLIVVGDFNNDTLSDIVILVDGDHSIKILLGYGNGSFAKLRSPRTHGSARYLAVGDINNDSFLDIVFLYGLGQDIRVLHGYGNGSFQATIISPVESSAALLAIGDFNNDGQLDIVTLDSVYSNVRTYLGYGNGSFAGQTTYSVGCFPIYIAVADLNNDGQLDIVTANTWGNDISVLLGDGNGSFTPPARYSTGLRPSSMVIGDFNNDTRMDIGVTNSGSSTVSILLGNFNQVFKRHLTLINGKGSRPQSVATGDFNNDTHPDIAIVNSGTHTLGIFLGHGNGSFSAQVVSPTVSSPSLIAVGYLNNDTHLDVIVVSFTHSVIVIHLGDGNGSFANYATHSINVYSEPKSVSVADFDNDDILDIIIANFDPSNVVVFAGDGNGGFATAKEVWIGYGTHPFSVTVGDFNSDKKLDFAVANDGTDNLQILLQTC